MREFVFERDPHEEGVYLYKKKKIVIQEGVTVLVGCNGSGKTTLLRYIAADLKKTETPYVHYNNMHGGDSTYKTKKIMQEDYRFLAQTMMSSEGETIVLNMNCVTEDILNMFKQKKSPASDIVSLFRTERGEDATTSEKTKPKEYWLLLDAVDSGLSIDNVLDMKKCLFDAFLKIAEKADAKGYIVVSANAYEMCNGEKCFSVQDSAYVDINNYEEYREFILKSKKRKLKLLKDTESKK